MSDAPNPTAAELAAVLADLRSKEEALAALEREKYEPIAIVGMGLRIPGGNNDVDTFARFLREGRSGVGPLPADERRQLAQDRVDREGEDGVPGGAEHAGDPPPGGFVRDVDRFDAAFFSVSPKEAPYIDPQQRLALQTAWEALEHAGIDPTSLRHGDTGVFMGVTTLDYIFESTDLAPADVDGYLAPGLTHSAVSGRLSYFLGLRGPCMTVDTTCSSSLTATHLAVQALRGGECGVALSGGVNVIHNAHNHTILSLGGVLAADGQCKTFDERADGYARAEGCGVLVLKRLSDARRDGDTVHALIRGSAVGQDGESAGLVAPNGAAQEQVMRSALARCRLEPGDIQYVEAHGTGTALGDPTEMDAISDVFADSHTHDRPVVVGSLKTNIGHMEGAAGVGSLIKAALQLRERTVFPHLNLVTPSPRIAWDEAPVTVPTELRPWPGTGTGRAMVNGFGVTGTIASVVLEEAPAATATDEDGADARPGAVLTLSAKNRTSLRKIAERYLDHLEQHPDTPLADLCRTSNTGRAHFRHRIAEVVGDRDDAVRALGRRAASLAAGTARGGGSAGVPKVAFLFSGTGTQYPGMGAALHRQYPVFRAALDECDAILTPLLGVPLGELVRGECEAPERIDEPRYLQPALFSLEYAMARLWLSWGVRPSVLMGHSLGEFAAAAVAGLFSLEDGARLVAARGRLSEAVRDKGGMAAVGAPAAEVAPLVEDYPDLSIGAVNGPGQCLLTGGHASLADAGRRLTERGGKVTPLRGAVPYHSPLMAEIVDEFREVLATVEFRTPTMAVVSNVTGRVARGRQMADPEYWIRHLLEPVRFEAGVQTVDQRGRHVFVELGPSAALTALARTAAGDADHVWLSSTFRDDHDGDMIRRSLAKAYEAGVPVSWAGYHEGAPRRRVPLPSYAFDGKRYWLPTPQRRAAEAAWRAERTPEGERGASGGLFYEQHWISQPLPGTRRDGRRVLVVGETARLPRGLAEAAASEGVALTVAPGPAALADALDGALDGEPPTDVCWLWRTGTDGTEAGGTTGAARLRAECETNYRELLAVLDTLARKGFGRGQRLWLVSEGAQHLPGDKSTEPAAAATLWGFGRALALEYPGYRATLVDLRPRTDGTDGTDGTDNAAGLVGEWLAAGESEPEIVHRDGERWVRRLRTADPVPADSRPLTVRPDRTYVVAGATGMVGGALARRLVALGARHLALLSRTGGPAPALGDGVTASVYACDLGSERDVTHVLAELAAAAPPVGGVIHAAQETARDLPLAEQTWESLDAVFRTKVYGAWLLHEATAHLPEPAFFLGCSTAGTLLGAATQTGAGAGNAFLDHLMAQRAGAGLPAVAVNWGPWAPREPGRRLSSSLIRSWEGQGITLLDEDEATGALPHLLDAGRTHLLMGHCDWDRFVARRAPSALFAELVSGPAADGARTGIGALTETAGAARSAGINAIVRTRLADVLRFESADDLEPDAELAALGMDSLNAVEIRSSLESAFRVTLPASITFDRPSVDLLTAYIEQLLSGAGAPAHEAGTGAHR
ncbi:acyltransferase domain-containing protein [Streptomyces sp. G44]|uniref:type I polyketide synthase n=1 Tax=Streptomyces sp. G44 TaxID=2807632 RepID=UPI0019600A4C|nr:type I polyketide synthase [Streptomyces sp. G44]MBM7172011.1 acyltransferase domain-containing protein [Streptomyces sp. G44]